MECIRCGGNRQIEEHHIIELSNGGGNEPENKEYRCQPCHKYEHTRRALTASLERERRRGQQDRIRGREHRLEVLEQLNTIELIRERGTYLGYWTVMSTRYLPRRIPTREEVRQVQESALIFEEAMVKRS